MKRKAPGSKSKTKTKQPVKPSEQAQEMPGVQFLSGAAVDGVVAALLGRMDRHPQNFIWLDSDFD